MSIIAEIKNLKTGIVSKIVRRTKKLDDVLIKAGYDVSEINTVVTPLIGASRYATIKVLIASNGLGGLMTAPYSKQSGDDETNLFSFTLYEPSGGGGRPVDPNTNQRGNGTVVLGGNNETLGGASGGIRQDSVSTGGGGVDNFTGSNSIAPPSTLPLLATTPAMGRYLKWSNLICTSIQELILSAGASKQKIMWRPPIDTEAYAQPAIYVMELADARYILKNQMLCELGDSTDPKRGTSLDQWNMIAENPLHLIQSTVKSSVKTVPDTDLSYILEAGMDIDPADLVGVLQPNAWYEDTAYTPKEIIGNIIAKFKDSKLWGDKDAISFLDGGITDSYSPKSSFDCINLDLRARTVGEALDEIAARIGCVWAWDRRLSMLDLREADPIKDEPILLKWLERNEMYRAAGGINSLSIDMPDSVVSVHPIRMVSTYGAFASEIIQDWRVFPAKNGVEDFAPTTPLYYVNEYPRKNKYSNRTAYIGDHLPAFLGVVSSDVYAWFENIPTIEQTVVDIEPWNYSFNPSSLWNQKPWTTTLRERNGVLSERYQRLKDLVSGNLILSRIPANGAGGPMDFTPSVGFQWDAISFGFETKQQVQYRIHGDKKDSLLLPSLISQPRVSALGLTRCRNVLGTLNIEYLKPRSGIVRTFICSFKMQLILKTDASSGEATMWLYKFNEVQLSNLPYPKWQGGDETNSLSGATGYALNLCELMPANATSPPTVNFDGGHLFYPLAGQSSAATSVMLTPVGGGETGLTMCYEIINEGGATTYWIAIPNGVRVACSTIPLTGINGKWQDIGISGVGFPSSVPLVDRII